LTHVLGVGNDDFYPILIEEPPRATCAFHKCAHLRRRWFSEGSDPICM